MSSSGQQTARCSGAVWPAAALRGSKREPFGSPWRKSGANGSRWVCRGATEVQTGAGWGAGALRQVKWVAVGSPGRKCGSNGSRWERRGATAGQTGAVGSTIYAEAVGIESIAVLTTVPRCFRWNRSRGGRFPAPEGPLKVAGGKPRPQGEAHPPVSQPDLAAPRQGAHERPVRRDMAHAPRRGAGHSGARPGGCAPLRSIPPATFIRASSAKAPRFDATENSDEP